MIFLHELPDIKELFEVVANERQILPLLVEKDYWIMHCLWGLQQQIYPKTEDNLPIGKNQDKPKHIESRQNFFDEIAASLVTPGIKFRRDFSFDDNKKMHNAGIRGEYLSSLSSVSILKEGIVFELGFDKVTPNLPCDLTSWAFEKASTLNLSVATNIKGICVCILTVPNRLKHL